MQGHGRSFNEMKEKLVPETGRRTDGRANEGYELAREVVEINETRDCEMSSGVMTAG